MDADSWKFVTTIVTFILGVGGLKWYNTWNVTRKENRDLIRNESRADLITIIEMQKAQIDELKNQLTKHKKKI